MRYLLFLLFSLCLLLSPAFAAPPAERGGPIDIKSNELVTDSKQGTATFIGSVVARQGDMTLYSDRLVIHSSEAGEADWLEATGKVRIVQEKRIGTGERAFYDLKEGKITLTGSPKVQQERDFITGTVITYYVDQEKSVVSGSSDTRVRAVIHPKGKAGDGSTR